MNKQLIKAAIEEALEYFDNRSDADWDGDEFRPNQAMRLAMTLEEALTELEI